MNNYLIKLFVLLLLFKLNFLNAGAIKNIYVNKYSTCLTACGGSSTNGFNSLYDALEDARQSIDQNTIINVANGLFMGLNNKGLVISGFLNTYLTIQGTGSTSSDTTFDCELNGQWLRIEYSKPVTIKKMTIRNCYAYQGAGIQVYQSDIVLSNLNFDNNRAYQGAGIYFDNSRSSTLSFVSFLNNYADEQGTTMYAKKSQIQLYTITYVGNKPDPNTGTKQDIFHCVESNILGEGVIVGGDTPIVHCGSKCSVIANSQVVCNTDYFNSSTENPQSKRWETQFYLNSMDTCIDNIVQNCQYCINPIDSCLTCAACSCHSSGFLFETKKTQTCTISRSITDFSRDPIDILSRLANIPITATLKGYIQVKKAKSYQFTIYTSFISMNIQMDGRILYAGEQHRQSNSFNISIYMVPNTRYLMTATIRSQPIGVNEKRSLMIKNLDEENLNIYYSNRECGDKLLKQSETTDSCQVPDLPISNGIVTCGDGICNEVDPNSCISDCYDYITKECESRKVPSNHIAPGFVIDDDTIGSLIDNQMIWHLPGSEHFTMGIDIVTGKSAAAPLFYFGYCNDNTENLIQDVLRTSTYELPDELTGKMLPQCSFSTTTKTYTSTEDIRKEKEESSTMAFDASASVEGWSVSATGSAAYSKDTSIQLAESISTEQTKTYFQSEISCSISSVEMVKHTFHPIFLKEISQVSTQDEMFNLIMKYGTHYIKSAALGGKLLMITTTNEEMKSEEHQNEWSEAVKRSASVSFKSPILSGGGSYSDSFDVSQNLEQQEDKESKSSRTTVIAIGGAPGSYSPDSQSKGKMFTSWAESIDLHPVPLNQDLFPISSVIPESWLVKNSQSTIKSLWLSAEQQYYNLNQYSDFLPFKYAIFLHFQSVNSLSTLPIVHCTWTSTDQTQKTNVFKISHKQVLGEYKDSIEFIPDFSPPSGLTTRSMKLKNQYWTWADNQVDPEDYTMSMSYSHQVTSPLRYDISMSEDFFNSPTQPQFQIEGMEQFTQASIHIINLRTSKAIILRKDGNITKDNSVYVAYASQFLGFGGMLPEELQGRLQILPGAFGYSMSQLLGSTVTTAVDKLELYYKYNDDTMTLVNTGQTYSWKDKSVDKILSYSSFSIVNHKFGETLKFLSYPNDKIGSEKRINWLYAAIPIEDSMDTGSKWWIKDIQAMVADYSDFGSYALYKSTLSLKLAPLKPENSDYYLYTKNTLRYESIFPTFPDYKPVGRYPLPEMANYGLLCAGMIKDYGTFFDFTSISTFDFNITYGSDLTYYVNLCSRAKSCVDSSLNIYGDPNIQSCSIPKTTSSLTVHSIISKGSNTLTETSYGIQLKTTTYSPSESICTSTLSNTIQLYCDPSQLDPILISVTSTTCDTTSKIITSKSCSPNIYYDAGYKYFYDLRSLSLPDGTYYEYSGVNNNAAQSAYKFYFNLGGYVDLCTDRESTAAPYEIYQSCLWNGVSYIKTGKLTTYKTSFDSDGNGITISYKYGTNSFFSLYLTCDSTTSFQITKLEEVFSSSYKVYIKSNFACGTRFSDSVFGIPSWYKSTLLFDSAPPKININ